MVGTHAAGLGGDLLRGRAQLLAENALLRQQLLVLRRSVKRPAVTRADRALLVLLAGRVRAWREALLVIQPETLLRWHRAGFRACWRRKSRPGPGRPPLPAETVVLIRRLAADNPLWGAERIRGELGKLGLRVAKRIIQTYLRGAAAPLCWLLSPSGDIFWHSLRKSARYSWWMAKVASTTVQHWRDALLIVRPETVLRWHRAGLRLFWKAKSRAKSQEPRIAAETIALIQEMVVSNRLWGAERIRGELLKLGITVAKRTIQRHMRQARPSPPRGQTWATFLRNHATDIWACDFVQLTDVWFRPLFAFVITALGSRRIVHVGVTRAPTDAWVAQQLREATPFGAAPKYLIRDNDAKYGHRFDTIAAGTGITLVRTPIRAPRANAICERLVGSLRRECLDHILLMSEAHLRRVLKEYVQYFNQSRPHQGIDQHVPEPGEDGDCSAGTAAEVIAFPLLGGLHHAYRRAA